MKKLKTFIMTFVMVFATVIFSGCALKKMPVPNLPRRSVKHHHSRCVSLFQGMLRDQLLGKLVIKIRGL